MGTNAMKMESFTPMCGKDRFAITIQIESKDLRPLQNQAYKDSVSVQNLLQQWIETSLNDLVAFCKGA